MSVPGMIRRRSGCISTSAITIVGSDSSSSERVGARSTSLPSAVGLRSTMGSSHRARSVRYCHQVCAPTVIVSTPSGRAVALRRTSGRADRDRLQRGQFQQQVGGFLGDPVQQCGRIDVGPQPCDHLGRHAGRWGGVDGPRQPQRRRGGGVFDAAALEFGGGQRGGEADGPRRRPDLDVVADGEDGGEPDAEPPHARAVLGGGP